MINFDVVVFLPSYLISEQAVKADIKLSIHTPPHQRAIISIIFLHVNLTNVNVFHSLCGSTYLI